MRSDPKQLPDTDPAIIELQSRQPAARNKAMAGTSRIQAIANLGLTVSNPPTQGEVQAIANKVDQLLAAMRQAGHLAP